MSHLLPGSPASMPYMSHPDITLGEREGKWCVALGAKHPVRSNNIEVATSALSDRIRENKFAPVTIKKERTMGKNKSNRSTSKTRRVWPTVTMNWTSEEFGLLKLEIEDSPDTQTGHGDSKSLTGSLILKSASCHLCKMSGVDTLLTEGEQVKTWMKGTEIRVSGVSCEENHWQKSAKVTVPASPKEEAKPAKTAPKQSKPAAPKPSTPKASEAPAPKAPKSDIETTIRAAKAAGASMVKLADGTLIVF